MRFFGFFAIAMGAVLGYVAASGKIQLLLHADDSATAFQGNALQTTGKPGLPGATTTIDGKQLPPPDPNSAE
jgi:hypothetical protein